MPRRFGGAGCRYLLDQRTGGKRNDPCQCGAKEQPGSAYCPEHHALCYLPRSSVLEGRRLRQKLVGTPLSIETVYRKGYGLRVAAAV